MLGRGYSVTHTTDGDVVRNTGQLEIGTRISTTLADGRVTIRVETIEQIA